MTLIFDKFNACEYCDYKTACGFDERLGYARRVPEGAADAGEDEEE